MKQARVGSWLDVGGREAALVQRCAASDEAACAELVAEHQRMVVQLATNLLGDREEALDLSQEVFMRVFAVIHRFRGQSSLRTWIYRIAVNESLNLLRRNGHEEWLDDEIDLPGAESANPESQASDAERSRHIQRALMGLSPNDRTVLTLRHFSELSYQEIADVLEIDEKTVKSRLFEARHRLREALKEFRPG